MKRKLPIAALIERSWFRAFCIQLFFLNLLFIVPSYSQDTSSNTITGTVSDANGEPLVGVNIVVEGTETGAVTDLEGSYSISVADGATLVFSFLGYTPRKVVVEDQSIIDVSLEEEISALDEVVVIGYGTQRRADLTGSVSQVGSREINSFPATNVLQSLSGRAAGVQVSQTTGAPGAGLNVRIRGTNSIQGSNEPLYVVDGFPIFGNNPTVLNNTDIESMEVLKDASATAIYGSRGANGVVIITTKKGVAGETRVDLDLSYGQQELRKSLDLMNAAEYARFYNIKSEERRVGKECRSRWWRDK